MGQEHNDRIRDQFTRQAVPFASAAEIRNAEALQRIVDMAQTGPADTVLDVACGPGLLACTFAAVAEHVTGIDLTPKMLEQARVRQAQLKLNNLTWHEGDVLSLPFRDASFSIVATRFAFHHFLDPLVVLKEMRRVCRPGGRVVVVDTAPAEDKADAFNHMERLRDPSHVRALSPKELLGVFAAAGLPSPCLRHDDLRYELESFLARSFPDKGNADVIRHLFAESLESDSLGVKAVRKEGEIRFLFPTAIVVSTLPS